MAQGSGRRFWSAPRPWWRGGPSMPLHVFANNERARSVYDRFAIAASCFATWLPRLRFRLRERALPARGTPWPRGVKPRTVPGAQGRAVRSSPWRRRLAPRAGPRRGHPGVPARPRAGRASRSISAAAELPVLPEEGRDLTSAFVPYSKSQRARSFPWRFADQGWCPDHEDLREGWAVPVLTPSSLRGRRWSRGLPPLQCDGWPTRGLALALYPRR